MRFTVKRIKWGQAIFLVSIHRIKNIKNRRCSMRREKEELKIYCMFSDKGECVRDLIMQSLRNYIKISLQKTPKNLT